MLDDKVVERIKNIGLEEAIDELHAIVDVIDKTKTKRWFEIYANMLNDRRAYRAVGLEDKYAGEKDGKVNYLVDVRLKLLAFYTWRELR